MSWNCPWIERSLARRSNSTPAGEVVHVLVELIEEALRPRVEVAVPVQDRALDLRGTARFFFLPQTEEVEGGVFGKKGAALHGPPDTVQYVVAVRFKDDLHPGSRGFGQEFAHRRLPGRVEMHFGFSINSKSF